MNQYYNLTNMNGLSNMNSINNIEMNNIHNSDINKIDYDFIKYIKNGSDDVILINTLINNGANVNYVDPYGFTPLLYATTLENNIDIIRILLKNGADVSVKDKYGNGVLYNATSVSKNMETILLLIEYGSELFQEKYILHNAFKVKDIEVIMFLLKKGLDIFEKDDYQTCPFEYGNFELFKKVREIYNIQYDTTTAFKKDMNYYNITSTYNTKKNKKFLENLNTHRNRQNKNVNSNQENIIHDLTVKHTKFIENSSTREMFVLKQYTYHGDVIVNKFLRDEDSIQIYKKNLFDLKRKQSSDEQFFIFPYIYSMLDLGMILYTTNNYVYLFYEEYIYERVLNNILQNNIDWFRNLSYYYFIDLYKTIKKFPKASSPFLLYRGINHNYLQEEKWKTFYTNSFLSCSYKQSVAESFGKILLMLYVHPMCDYAYLESISIVGSEEEILLTPYLRYIVYDVNQDKTLWKIGVLPSDIDIPDYSDFLQFRKNIKGGGNLNQGWNYMNKNTRKNRGVHVRNNNKYNTNNITCKNMNRVQNNTIKESNIITSRSHQQLQSISEEIRPWKVRDATPDELNIIEDLIHSIDNK